MSRRLLNCIISCVALILGAVLYILFKETTHIAKLFSDLSVINSIKTLLSNYSCSFLICYLPDFLWSLSLCCGLVAIYNPKLKGTFFCGITACLYGFVWELLQYFSLVSGVADLLDVLMYTLGAALAVIINIKG